MGWTSRSPTLGADPARIVGGGMFARFALVNGRAAAIWRYSGGRISIEPFTSLSPADDAALGEDARDVVRSLARANRAAAQTRFQTNVTVACAGSP